MTAASIDEFCARASNRIDAKIGGKYTVPVDSQASPKAFSLLKEICCWLVYARIAPIMGLQTSDAKTSTGGPQRTDWNKKAEELLTEIQKGVTILVDATLSSSSAGVSSNPADTSSGSTTPITFRREQDDW